MVQVDRTPPTSTISGIPNEWVNHPVTLTVQATDLLSGISYAVTANPEPKVGEQANYETDDTTYSVASSSLVPVSPAAETADIDFTLGTVPGNVAGLVFEEGTDPSWV